MFKRWFSYLGIFFLSLLSLFPLPILYFFANILYVLLYHVFKYRRSVVNTNLRLSFPEKSIEEIKLIERNYYHYLSNLMVEVIKMMTISRESIQKRCMFKGMEKMESFLKKGQSILICSSHFGNWEWGSLAFSCAVNAIHCPIYKPLSNPVFDAYFKKVRSRFGNRMISMRNTLRAIKNLEQEVTAFTFANDQSPMIDDLHYWTTFLNQPASIQLGIEKIAKRTNRPIFYLKTTLIKKGYYEIDCVPLVLNPKETAEFEITEIHTRFLEKMIEENPVYWLWSHRRFKHKPGEGHIVKSERLLATEQKASM
ncbi:lysophospholipid acyltransferase family protein [Pedobacter sp. MW01-1-1]|uniref:lysophospholipid acyltransferase family protein n=1 Tax=Pedobacter sp. MW01-1-1 TaxID=3383027 RepID=UPI003FF02CEE